MTTESDIEEKMQIIGKMIDEALCHIHKEKRGFILLTAPFDVKKPNCDFISNVTRQDCIAYMREMADRMEQHENTPTH